MKVLLLVILAFGLISCDESSDGSIVDQIVDVTSYSPTTSPAAGGGLMTISGNDIDDMNTVTIGSNQCNPITIIDQNTVTCVIPAGTASTTVEVTFQDNAGNRKIYSQNAFTYN